MAQESVHLFDRTDEEKREKNIGVHVRDTYEIFDRKEST